MRSWCNISSLRCRPYNAINVTARAQNQQTAKYQFGHFYFSSPIETAIWRECFETSVAGLWSK